MIYIVGVVLFFSFSKLIQSVYVEKNIKTKLTKL